MTAAANPTSTITLVSNKLCDPKNVALIPRQPGNVYPTICFRIAAVA